MHAPYHTPSGTPMLTELTGYEVQLDRIVAEAEGLMAHLTDEQFNWRPAPGRWSIAENLDHLRATGAQYVPAIDEAIAAGQARSLYGEGPFRYGPVERFLAWSMEPPVRVRLKTLGAITPAGEHSLGIARPAFLHAQEELRARIRRANGLDLSRVRVRSPLVTWLQLSLGKALAFLLAHERRHLWQAKEVRRLMG
jgi:hypothetical protein